MSNFCVALDNTMKISDQKRKQKSFLLILQNNSVEHEGLQKSK